MNLKYYLRGLGIGILVTALIMGVSFRDRARSMTEEEIRREASKLGMVDGKTVLSQHNTDDDVSQEKKSAVTAKSQDQVEDDDNSPNTETDSENTQEQSSEEIQEQEASKEDEGEKDPAPETGNDIQESSTRQQDQTIVEDHEKSASAKADGEDGVQGASAGADSESGVQGASAGADSESGVQGASAGADSEEDVQSTEKTQATQKQVTIAVNRGEGSLAVSRKLAKAGLVDSADEYDKFLCRHGYDKRLRVGSFTIPAGSDDAEIAEILTVR